MKIYKVPLSIEIDQDTLDGILDSAINWCSYWCYELSVGKKPAEALPYNAMSEMVTRGGTLVFKLDEPYEDGGKTRFELTERKLLKGLAKCGRTDFEDFDGPMSDCVLQYALFDEVIYG